MGSKATSTTNRAAIRQLTELINVGDAAAADLRRIGINRPQQLIGRDPWKLYCDICSRDKAMHDPCLVDLLMSAVEYMNGGKPQKWWKFTARRKSTYGTRLREMRTQFSTRAQTKPGNKKRRSKIATA